MRILFWLLLVELMVFAPARNAVCQTSVSVMNFGAVGNGVADDTTAFQNAINAVSPGQSVFVPATTSGYVLGQLTMRNSVPLQCAAGTTFLASSNTETMFKIGNNVNQTGLTGIGGYCTVSSNGKSGFTAFQIGLYGGASSTNNIVQNVIIQSPAVGIDTQETYFDLFQNVRVIAPTTGAFQFETSTTTLNCINCSSIATTGTPYCFFVHNGGSMSINGTCEGTERSAVYQENNVSLKVYFENSSGTNTGAWIQIGTQTGSETSGIDLSGSTFSVGAQYAVDIEQVYGLSVCNATISTALGAFHIHNSGSPNGQIRGLDFRANDYNINGAGHNPAKVMVYSSAPGTDLSNNVATDSPNPIVCSPVAPGSLVTPPPAALSKYQGVTYCDGSTGYLNYQFKDGSGTLRQNIQVTDLTLSAIATFPNIVQPGAGSVNNAITGTLVNSLGDNVPVAAGLRIVYHLTGGLSLQAGANTLNLNGSGDKSIVRATNSSTLLTAFANGAYVDMMFDGMNWQVLSQ